MAFKYTKTTLDKLQALFEEAKYTLRYEKGNFQSGYCIMEQRKVVVVNKFLDIEGRINALIEIMSNIAVDVSLLSLEGHKLLLQIQTNKQSNTAAQNETTQVNIVHT